MKSFRTIISAGALLLAAPTAFASPMTYTFSGYGAGSLNGMAFNQESTPVFFKITAEADTDNAAACAAQCTDIANDRAFIQIDNIGTFEFLIQTRVFYAANVGTVGFSRNYPEDKSDLFDLPGITDWHIDSPMAQTSGIGVLVSWSDDAILTSGGVLAFDSTYFVPATFSAVPSVPEPGTWTLIGAGLLTLTLRRTSPRAVPRT